MGFDEITNKIMNDEPISFEEGRKWAVEGMNSHKEEMDGLLRMRLISDDGAAGIAAGIREVRQDPPLALAAGGWDIGAEGAQILKDAFEKVSFKNKKLFLLQGSSSKSSMELLFPNFQRTAFFTSNPEQAGFLARALTRLGSFGYVFCSSLLKETSGDSFSYITAAGSGHIHSARVAPARFALPPWEEPGDLKYKSLTIWMAGVMTAAAKEQPLLPSIDEVRNRIQ